MVALEAAFKDGASVTAKVLWMPKSANIREQGRPRYIRCTPLLGADEKVGVWMVILVPLEDAGLGVKYGNAGLDSVIGLNGTSRGRPKQNPDELDGMFLDNMSADGNNTTYAERRSTVSYDSPQKIRSSTSTPILSDRQVQQNYSHENLQQLRHGAGTPVSTRRSQSRTASLRVRGGSVSSDIDGVMGVRSASAMASTSQLLGALDSHPHSSAIVYRNGDANVNGVYSSLGRYTGDGREGRERKRNVVVSAKSATWTEDDADVSQMYAEHLRGSGPSIDNGSRSTPSQGSSEADYAFVEAEKTEIDSPIMGRRVLVTGSERGNGTFTPPPSKGMRRDVVEISSFE